MSQMVDARDVRTEAELGLTLDDLYRLSVEQYEQMARHGILKKGILPPRWFVNSQNPVSITEGEPEPDASVIRGHRRDYLKRKPGLGDTVLVIEVADATLRQDRGVKKYLYAQAGIPVYWLINLRANLIEVYTDPTGPAEKPTYHQRQDYGRDDTLPVVIEGQAVGRLAVSELLP